jgi:SAM-dependent methyltransferase
MNSEIEEIKARYRRREGRGEKMYLYSTAYTLFERELQYKRLIFNVFGQNLGNRKILEIGAGHGDNLLFFQRIGFNRRNIYGNELLPGRGVILADRLGIKDNIHIGNALDLEYQNEFDIVFQSLVFTSVLDHDFRRKLAEKMLSMTKSEGIILFYDFKYNNPRNRDVMKVSRKEIKDLFTGCRIEFHNVTLAPPIARMVGRFYGIFNTLFPFLRTHLIAVIHPHDK